MAASLLFPKPSFNQLINTRNFSLGKTLNLARYNKSRFVYKGPLREEGDYVTHRTTIYKQYAVKYCPGLNVISSTHGQVQAMVPGTVMITTEKTNFDFDKKWVFRVPNAEGVKYMDYIHVIPEPQHNRFKLVDTV